MRNWSIATKITISAWGLLLLLVVLGGALLVPFEIRREQELIEQFRDRITTTLNDREREEKEILLRNVAFHARILSQAGATDLYNLRDDDLKGRLRSYLDYPEIIAIQALDEFAEPFAAAWKIDEIQVAEALPEELPLDDDLSVTEPSFYEDEPIGSFQVFYTDAVISAKIKRHKEQAVADIQTFQSTSRARLRKTLIWQGAGVVVILLVLGIFLIRSLHLLVFRPLHRVTRIAEQLKDFDLTVEIHPRRSDEVGHLMTAIRSMVHSFRRIVKEVQHSSLLVASSAEQLSVTAKEQEKTVATQMHSITMVVQSVEAISSVVNELGETMQQVAAISEETAGHAGSSQGELLELQHTMQQMEQHSDTISQRLTTLHERTGNITSVVTTITKVADQTNMLSLNAAIEAEQAGEIGRGFAVVAREIRRLADQTAVATLDIEEIVEEMQSAVSGGVTEMERFVSNVQHSARDVTRISSQLARIIEQVQTLSPTFEHVNQAMQQQSENTRSISDTMSELEENMSETTASLQETFQAITQLNAAAQTLQDEISAFKIE